MFKQKYIVTLLNSNWSVLKNRVFLEVIPSIGEFIFYQDSYFEIISVVHTIDTKHGIFIILEKQTNNKENINLIINKLEKNDDKKLDKVKNK